MSEVSAYDEVELRQWIKIVSEVNVSWRRIYDYLSENSERSGRTALQKVDAEKIANAIVFRWFFPSNGLRSTSTAELKKIYMPDTYGAALMGDFESALDKKAYDRVRTTTNCLIEFDLIEKLEKRIRRETHYIPTGSLLEYCSDSSARLRKEFL